MSYYSNSIDLLDTMGGATLSISNLNPSDFQNIWIEIIVQMCEDPGMIALSMIQMGGNNFYRSSSFSFTSLPNG